MYFENINKCFNVKIAQHCNRQGYNEIIIAEANEKKNYIKFTFFKTSM